MDERREGIPRNVKILSLVSYLNDVASEMIVPIIPLFLVNVLGAPVYIVGLIEGLADSVSKILQAVFGIISDRMQKRKVFVVVGYALAAFSHLIMVLAGSWPVVMAARVIHRTGKGMRTSSRDAIIAESALKSERGRSFGFHRMMDTLGGMTGPILAVILLPTLSNNYRSLFWLAFFPALLGVLLLILFIKESPTDGLGLKKMYFEWRKANDSLKIFILISFIFAVGNSSEAFMVLRAQDLGLSTGLTLAAYTLFFSANALFAMPAGIIADKHGGRRVLFAGFVLFALVYMALGIIKNSSWVWLLFPLYGVFMAFTDGVSKTYISKLIPHEISASTFGIYQTLMGVGAFFASAIAGVLWTAVGPWSPFVFGGVLAFIAATLFIALHKRIQSIQPVA